MVRWKCIDSMFFARFGMDRSEGEVMVMPTVSGQHYVVKPIGYSGDRALTITKYIYDDVNKGSANWIFRLPRTPLNWKNKDKRKDRLCTKWCI